VIYQHQDWYLWQNATHLNTRPNTPCILTYVQPSLHQHFHPLPCKHVVVFLTHASSVLSLFPRWLHCAPCFPCHVMRRGFKVCVRVTSPKKGGETPEPTRELNKSTRLRSRVTLDPACGLFHGGTSAQKQNFYVLVAFQQTSGVNLIYH
jgi:hypothetical protein